MSRPGVGHRPGVFHLFRHETDEQVRGVSAFSKGIELFRNLSDAISYELFAQVIAGVVPRLRRAGKRRGAAPRPM